MNSGSEITTVLVVFILLQWWTGTHPASKYSACTNMAAQGGAQPGSVWPACNGLQPELLCCMASLIMCSKCDFLFCTPTTPAEICIVQRMLEKIVYKSFMMLVVGAAHTA